MKKSLCGLCVLVMLLATGGAADAILITVSDDIFFDNETNLYWYDNPGAFNTFTYQEQQDKIAGMSLKVEDVEYAEWEMATQQDMQNLISYNNTENWKEVFDPVWVMTIDAGGVGYSMHASAVSSSGFVGTDVVLGVDGSGLWTTGYVDTTAPYSWVGAWVVQQAPAAPTPNPEPATILLLGAGLAGLAGVRRKFKK